MTKRQPGEGITKHFVLGIPSFTELSLRSEVDTMRKENRAYRPGVVLRLLLVREYLQAVQAGVRAQQGHT